MNVSTHLREALNARFPVADFGPYFVFLESRPARDREGSERHHILPGREFPEFLKTPENQICLSSADHLLAHYWLALCAPQCSLFQRTFFMMSNLRKSVGSLKPKELNVCIEIYEKGRKAQAKIAHLQGLKNTENGRIQGRRNVKVAISLAFVL